MKITAKTRTADVLLLMNAERMEKVLDSVDPVPLSTPVVDMTLAEFAEALEDEYALRFFKQKRALIAFGQLKQFKQEMENLTKYIKKSDVKQTPDEEKAAIGVDFPNLLQRMLLDCVTFFGLHSFDDAEKCTVSDWLTIRKDKLSAMKFQRNIDQLRARKNGK